MKIQIPFSKIKLILIKFYASFYFEILIISVVLVFVAGIFFWLWPEFQQIQSQTRFGLKSIQSHEGYLNNYLKQLVDMDKDYNDFSQQQLAKLKSILPNEEDIAGLFVQLPELAERNNFKLGSLSITRSDVQASGPAAPINPAGSANGDEAPSAQDAVPVNSFKIGQLNITFAIDGNNYSAMKRFLTDVESNLRLFDIANLTFGSTEEGPYGINLRTYYLLP